MSNPVPECDKFYALRHQQIIEIEGIKSDHIYVDKVGDAWLAIKRQVGGSCEPYSMRGTLTYSYEVLIDREGNKISAPENWFDQKLPQ